MKIEIPGKPIAKKRPRFARRGKFVVTYNDQETEEGKWILFASQQITEKILRPKGILLQCAFYMPIPKSMTNKQKALIEAHGLSHTKKPDLDNLVKFVKDCLNGLAWEDDSQVVYLMAEKLYDKDPRTAVVIEPWH